MLCMDAMQKNSLSEKGEYFNEQDFSQARIFRPVYKGDLGMITPREAYCLFKKRVPLLPPNNP